MPLTVTEEFLINNLKARLDHTFEVMWYTPIDTLKLLIALEAKGVLAHYPEASDMPERYVLLQTETERQLEERERARAKWIEALSEVDSALGIFKRRSLDYLRTFLPLPPTPNTDLDRFWMHFENDLRAIHANLAALPLDLERFVHQKKQTGLDGILREDPQP